MATVRKGHNTALMVVDVQEGVMSFLEKRQAVFTERVTTDLPDIFPEWEEPEFF